MTKLLLPFRRLGEMVESAAGKGELSEMFSRSRRRFLEQATLAGVAAGSANLVFRPFLSAQSQSSPVSPVVRLYVDTRRTTAPLDRNVFRLLP